MLSWVRTMSLWAVLLAGVLVPGGTRAAPQGCPGMTDALQRAGLALNTPDNLVAGDYVYLVSRSGNVYEGTVVSFDTGQMIITKPSGDTVPVNLERIWSGGILRAGDLVEVVSVRGNARDGVVVGIDPVKKTVKLKRRDGKIEDLFADQIVWERTTYLKPLAVASGGVVVDGIRVHGVDGPAVVKAIKENGLWPESKVDIGGGASVEVSSLFDIGGGRVAAFVLVRTPDGAASLRVFYRSNSQGTFRVLPARNKDVPYLPGYDKGPGEDALNAPALLDQALAARLTEGDIKRLPNGEALMESAVRVNTSLEEWTAHRASGFDVTTAVKVSKLELNPALGARVRSPGGREFPAPQDIVPRRPGESPDFTKQPTTYAARSALGGDVTAYTYPSRDGSLGYTFFMDGTGHAWVARIEVTSAPLTAFGVRASAMTSEALLMPRWEYRKQTPSSYIGETNPTDSAYVDAFSYIREIPMIKDLYRALGREIPQ